MKLHSIIKTDTIFMNSENSKTSELHILILKLPDKLNLRRGVKIIALSKFKHLLHMEKRKKLIQ